MVYKKVTKFPYSVKNQKLNKNSSERIYHETNTFTFPKYFSWVYAIWYVLWCRKFNISCTLGQEAGSNIFLANIGFMLTAIGLPFLGIVAMGISRSEGLFDLASRINKPYAHFVTVLFISQLGLLLQFHVQQQFLMK